MAQNLISNVKKMKPATRYSNAKKLPWSAKLLQKSCLLRDLSVLKYVSAILDSKIWRNVQGIDPLDRLDSI